jgi:hypothetical protein
VTRRKYLLLLVIATWAAVMLTGNAFGGEIYSCVDKGGKKRIQDIPCGKVKNFGVPTSAAVVTADPAAPPSVDTLHPSQAGYEAAWKRAHAQPKTRQQAAMEQQLERARRNAAGVQGDITPSWPSNRTPNQFATPQAVPSVIAPPPIIESPPVIVNCDQAGCWDTSGKRYNHGAGPTFFRSDGKTCNSVPGFMNCN